jgi:hypothetical protein
MDPIPDVDPKERSVEANIGECVLELRGVCEDVIETGDATLTQFAVEAENSLQGLVTGPLPKEQMNKTIRSLLNIHNGFVTLLTNSGLSEAQKSQVIIGLKHSEDLLKVLIVQYNQVGGSRRRRQTRRLRKRRQLSQRRRRSQ